MLEILHSTSSLLEHDTEKILRKIHNLNFQVDSIFSEYIYVVDVISPLNSIEYNHLYKILQNKNSIFYKKKSFDRLFLVAPRPGVFSSWSSKATNIVHSCNLYKIKRIERISSFYIKGPKLSKSQWEEISILLYDRMTEIILDKFQYIWQIFDYRKPQPIKLIDILNHGHDAIEQINNILGLALNKNEIDYLFNIYKMMNRNPSDVEIYMFAQANSDHCRHKTFNADWIINGQKQSKSLIEMIKNTFVCTPDYVISAYHDNSAIIKGFKINLFFADFNSRKYKFYHDQVNIVMKVETHNHPTAISPRYGAATGSGGEIRDESATGRGAKPKAGLAGFSVSNLRIPGFIQPWEYNFGKPDNIASALDIILEGPIGNANFNNEFGRPIINGYFRTYEEKIYRKNNTELRGYHKPIMISGGIGSIMSSCTIKQKVNVGAKLIILGGSGKNVGLGGSTASSKCYNQQDFDLNYSSVQRDNPEMERRCQEVINQCCYLEHENPILFIHDVGAGGLANAILELINNNNCGGYIDLRKIINDESSMTPLEIWCNESQERYILAVMPHKLSTFIKICKRERTPYAIIGETIKELRLLLVDNLFKNRPVDMPLDLLTSKVPKLIYNIEQPSSNNRNRLVNYNIPLDEAIRRVLHLPVVSDKTFLISIADRSVTGMIVRDQMVGPWQVPVADCAVISSSFDSYYGEAISIGERSPIALIDASASARMAVGEAITNIASTFINSMKEIKFSANWNANSNNLVDSIDLYNAVKTIGEDVCPELGITIPVGKDSMSMRTIWQDNDGIKEMTAPISLVITAISKVEDVRLTVTPQLHIIKDNMLLFIDLGKGYNSLGATALSQVYRQLGSDSADLRDLSQLKKFFNAVQYLISTKKILAYHDKSDGGLFVTLIEMAFAGHCGLRIDITDLGLDYLSILFNEELGVVIQVHSSDVIEVKRVLSINNLLEHTFFLGKAIAGDDITFASKNNIFYREKRGKLISWWSETTWKIQRLRDNPKCADQEYKSKMDNNNPGLNVFLNFEIKENLAPFFLKKAKPKVAILREQGTNSHIEMAAAFYRAGFEAIDLHMNDLVEQNLNFNDINVLVACGGFSYGDVLGAGRGWANSILLNNQLRDKFESFFQRSDTLALGVCNGCQMMSYLRDIIPGSGLWPLFTRNISRNFESRFVLVEVEYSPSLFLDGMEGSIIPIAVSHSEGSVKLRNDMQLLELTSNNLISLRYVDNYRKVTEYYPANPNGSPQGITALTNKSGRVTIMMPHPERVFRTINNSWHPDDWGEDGPWMRLFYNARKYV